MGSNEKPVGGARFLHEVWEHFRPMLITIFALGMAYGTWRADNLQGTKFFLGVAAFPPALRLVFYGKDGLRYLYGKWRAGKDR